ncbi:MAG: hypothetical protein HRT89_06360 [Lentisphaeria bacterium]|nr:hypothetical protein [Lentisphaeria bacterium]NQZ67675.1 hypothetical protein [Lentisphaeria bacterium]
MMKILMTKDEVEISGDLQSLNIVGRIISDFLLESDCECTVYADQVADPSPYTMSAQQLIVTKSDGPAKITISEPDTLCLSGSVDNIERFLSFMEFDGQTPNGTHNHFDGLAGDGFVAEDSVETVLTLMNTQQEN